jgi:hypothetical protein
MPAYTLEQSTASFLALSASSRALSRPMNRSIVLRRSNQQELNSARISIAYTNIEAKVPNFISSNFEAKSRWDKSIPFVSGNMWVKRVIVQLPKCGMVVETKSDIYRIRNSEPADVNLGIDFYPIYVHSNKPTNPEPWGGSR